MTGSTHGATSVSESDDAHNPEPSTPLTAGARAPDFMPRTPPDQEVALSDFRGQPVILAFYPPDWSPVRGDQMALYNEILPELQRLGAELIGISVDGVWCPLAFAKDCRLRFPLLSDFELKDAVARKYGVYRHRDGMCGRALFVIDGDGVIRWSYLSPIGVNPGADGILHALESMRVQPSSQAPADRRQPAAQVHGSAS